MENVGFGPGEICLGAASELTIFSKHEGSAMLLEWGDADPGSAVRWGLEHDLSDFSTLSFRVGKVHRVASDTIDQPLSLEIEIQTARGAASLVYDRVVPQDDFWDGPLGQNPPSVDFMHSVRIPMSEFCDQGIDLTAVSSLSIRVPPDQPTGEALIIDSIEFSHHAQDGSVCP